jgi:hypothetical protein
MSSSVLPLLDRRTMRSSRLTMPKSPCRASVGFRYIALVPVEMSVCEIFWAINPLFPTPVKRMEPLQAKHACRAFNQWLIGRFHWDLGGKDRTERQPTRRSMQHGHSIYSSGYGSLMVERMWEFASRCTKALNIYYLTEFLHWRIVQLVEEVVEEPEKSKRELGKRIS